MAIRETTEKEREEAGSGPAGKAKPLSLWRVLLLGLILIPINVFWTIVIEVRWYTLDGTSLPLFITPDLSAVRRGAAELRLAQGRARASSRCVRKSCC